MQSQVKQFKNHHQNLLEFYADLNILICFSLRKFQAKFANDPIGIINFVRTQNFPKSNIFYPLIPTRTCK